MLLLDGGMTSVIGVDIASPAILNEHALLL